MKITNLAAIAAIGSCLCLAQTPPPPAAPSPNAPPAAPAPDAPAAAANTVSGSISQFNYGPDGRVESFLLSPNTLVPLPPDWAVQMDGMSRNGEAVQVNGTLTVSPSGMRILRPSILRIGGKSLSLAQPGQPAPYTGNGVIQQLNYGPGGEVNGFMLQNRVLARTPPFGSTSVSVLKVGASIAFAGLARQTGSGRIVVQVQSITANGQTIALNAAPPPAPGPRPGPAPIGGPRGTPPPPPVR